MRKYLPHISYFSLLIIALMFSSRNIAAFIGVVVAHMTDPLVIIGAIAIGAFCKKQWSLLISSFFFAIAASIIILQVNKSLGTSFSLFVFFARFVAILTIAYLINAFRIIILQPTPEEEPSHVSKTKVRSEAEHQMSPDEIFRMIPRDEIIKAARWLARSEILKGQGKIEESLHFGQKALNVCLWYKISLDKIRPEAALQRVQLEKEYIEEARIKVENRWKFSDSKFVKQFISPEQWRLFLVLQVVGLVFAVYIDATSRLDLFPELPYRLRYIFRLSYWDWDLFTARHYTKSAPWFFLLGIFGPFALIKTFNWIRSAKADEKTK